MEYKYAGKTFYLSLAENGKIKCSDVAEQTDTVEEMKAIIKKRVTKEKKLPMVDIITKPRFGDRFEFIEGKSSLKSAEDTGYYTYVWVSWKEENRTQREKKSIKEVYKATEENKEKIVKIRELIEKSEALKKEAREISDSLEVAEVVETSDDAS